MKRLSGPSQFENFPSGFSLFTSYVTSDIYFLSPYITQSIPTGALFTLITVKFVMFALWDHEASPKILLSWVFCSVAVSIAINLYISWFWLKIIILYGPLPTAPPPPPSSLANDVMMEILSYERVCWSESVVLVITALWESAGSLSYINNKVCLSCSLRHFSWLGKKSCLKHDSRYHALLVSSCSVSSASGRSLVCNFAWPDQAKVLMTKLDGVVMPPKHTIKVPRLSPKSSDTFKLLGLC